MALVLESLTKLEQGRLAATTVTRIQNSDLVDIDLACCRLVILSPLSRIRRGARRDQEFDDELEGCGAAALVRHQINAGDDSIMSEIEGFKQRCSIRFMHELANPEHSETWAVEEAVNIVSRPAK